LGAERLVDAAHDRSAGAATGSLAELNEPEIWPAKVPDLGGDEVHSWLIELDAKTDEAVLSSDERARADAFRFDVHRRRYAAGRARLREILAAYLDAEPASLGLLEGPHGKPELTGHDLRFNLAHCEDRALCAVSRCEVGADLELLDRPRMPDWRAVAARFFHADEVAATWEEFLRIWTLKEACLKAAGFGLVIDPRTFSVAEVLAGRTDAVALAGAEWRCWELRRRGREVSAVAASTGPA
jgi:4'-phosphopantetheinyl transferase